jgi:hypothetical protein
MRRAEVRLWERGIRIISPEGAAARYQAALSADPHLAAYCDGYARLAARYRGELRELELEILKLHNQALDLGCKQAAVRGEYTRIKAEEEGASMD